MYSINSTNKQTEAIYWNKIYVNRMQILTNISFIWQGALSDD